MSTRRIWLVDARRRARLTQAQLAAAIGKPQNYISRLERGDIPDPTITTVTALGKALGLDPMTLRFGRREVAA